MNIKKTSREKDIDSARRVLGNEASALLALAQSLGNEFIEALNLLSGITGRIVVTGMGKSGHIANKIAASLASTGTPSIFVHPAEASHGDLGMITKEDAIFALSNSGETAELADLVRYATRFSIPIIGVTKNLESTLAKAANVALIYPVADEACPMGLAPTTSTTMMLGLGDAIAVALLERKGFSPDDFHVFHPGGKLGRQLLQVGDLMHEGDAVPIVASDTTLHATIVIMTEKSFGCACVIDKDNRLIGIVTDGDLRRAFDNPDLNTKVINVMTEAPKSVTKATLATEALRIMNENKITTLFAVENEEPIGILHIHDCLRAGIA